MKLAHEQRLGHDQRAQHKFRISKDAAIVPYPFNELTLLLDASFAGGYMSFEHRAALGGPGKSIFFLDQQPQQRLPFDAIARHMQSIDKSIDVALANKVVHDDTSDAGTQHELFSLAPPKLCA